MSEDAPAILLVDDDVDACHNVSDILGALGYRVDVAHDGVSALELSRGRSYDVALLDLRMPGLDGLSLSRRLRAAQPGMVTLLVTAFATEATAAEAIAAGAWRVLRKPVDVPALLAHIGEAVGQPFLLVVDDDRDLCDTLWDLLRERGFRVCLAFDADEAADRLIGARFDVLLIDLKLPGGDGCSVFRRARESDPRPRTVLITGARPETEPLVARAMDEGADAVCYKPLDPEALVATIERLVGASNADAR